MGHPMSHLEARGAEVNHLDTGLVRGLEQDVLRLEVAVDDPVLLQVAQARKQLPYTRTRTRRQNHSY